MQEQKEEVETLRQCVADLANGDAEIAPNMSSEEAKSELRTSTLAEPAEIHAEETIATPTAAEEHSVCDFSMNENIITEGDVDQINAVDTSTWLDQLKEAEEQRTQKDTQCDCTPSGVSVRHTAFHAHVTCTKTQIAHLMNSTGKTSTSQWRLQKNTWTAQMEQICQRQTPKETEEQRERACSQRVTHPRGRHKDNKETHTPHPYTHTRKKEKDITLSRHKLYLQQHQRETYVVPAPSVSLHRSPLLIPAHTESVRISCRCCL